MVDQPKKSAPGKKGGDSRDNASGWREIRRILKVNKDPWSKAGISLVCVYSVIFALIDMQKARFQGLIFGHAFLGNAKQFWRVMVKKTLLEFLLIGAQKSLAIIVGAINVHWQRQIVSAIHDEYFRDMSYYRLQGDVQAQNIIATDVPLLTKQMSIAVVDILNQSFQFVFYALAIVRLCRRHGATRGGSSAVLVFTPIGIAVASVAAFTPLMGNVAKLQKKEREVESAYRSMHMRLQANAEPVALLGGDEYEAVEIRKTFSQLVKQRTRQIKGSWVTSFLGDFLFRRLQISMLAPMLSLVPYFGQQRSSSTDAAQLMFETRQLSEFVMHETIALMFFMRTITNLQSMGGLASRVGGLVASMKKARRQRAENEGSRGRIIDGDSIAFDNVTVMTPASQTLCTGLSFEVREQDHLLVCGPNGAGKSSIFRCLGGLWAIPAGKITRPGGVKEGLISDVFYLPQKPYNVIGTMREQITYPEAPESLGRGAILDDSRLRSLLRMVELEYLMDLGTHEVFNWEDKLSLGETQRLAMARLFWHKPRFAILDECTSAVSLEMEHRLFVTCRRMGVTLITISHRPALQEYHNRMLTLDGSGGGEIEALEKCSIEGTLNSTTIITASDPCDASLQMVAKSRAASFDVLSAEFEAGRTPAVARKGHKVSDDTTATQPLAKQVGVARLYRVLLASGGEQLAILSAFTALIVVKTWLANLCAKLSGEGLRSMLKNDWAGFRVFVGKSLVYGLGQSVLTFGLQHVENLVALVWRKRLTGYMLERYLKNRVYFRLKTTPGDIKDLGHIEQILTEDVSKLTEGLASLWHEIATPVLQIAWFSRGMWAYTGSQGVALEYVYMMFGALLLRVTRPDLAGLVGKREKLNGEFLFVHSRLRQHSEAIAFFNGSNVERRIIEGHLENSLKHSFHQKVVESLYGMPKTFVSWFLPRNVSYVTQLVLQGRHSATHGPTTELSASEQGNLSLEMSYLGEAVLGSFTAFGELIDVYGNMQLLMGHAHRVSSLLAALDKSNELDSSGSCGIQFVEGADVVRFEGACVETPQRKQVLARDLNFSLVRGQDAGALIMGPNGVGKSSIFRALAGLWPLARGRICAPAPKVDMRFVPTTPYMALGTLVDQVTYPERLALPLADVQRSKLCEVLELCKIGYLGEREGFETRRESWEHRLSLGEQQRLGIARVFWHRPRFVCLDECTSAVSLDGEEEIYSALRQMGTMVLTASQKPWLADFHSHALSLTGDGLGSCSFAPIGDDMQYTGPRRLASKVYRDRRQRSTDLLTAQ